MTEELFIYKGQEIGFDKENGVDDCKLYIKRRKKQSNYMNVRPNNGRMEGDILRCTSFDTNIMAGHGLL